MIHLFYSHGTLAAENGCNVSWFRNAKQPSRLGSRQSIVGA